MPDPEPVPIAVAAPEPATLPVPIEPAPELPPVLEPIPEPAPAPLLEAPVEVVAPAEPAIEEDSLDWLDSFSSRARQDDSQDLLGFAIDASATADPEASADTDVDVDGSDNAGPAAAAEPEPEPEPATPRERAVALAARLGLAYVDLTEFSVDASVVGLIPDTLARRHTALPIARAGDRIMVALADPQNVVVLDDIAAVMRASVVSVVAEPEAILAAIDRYHRVDSEVEELTSAFAGGAEAEADPWSQDVGDQGTDEAPIIRFVNLIISQAITDRASDIHIEPMRDDLRVRYRIDGVLTTVQVVPRSMIPGVISRLKVMAELDIGERRRPQDGRISVSHSGRTVDLRVATLPTVWGEKVVARVLDSPVASLQLADLGMLDRNMEVFSGSFSKPYGMILVTGPTGSGKSTTLYTTLATISKPTVNVITVEDPVEYRMPGINQVQVNVKAGMTFAAALRSILRSDPDVILIGEIRDEETAKIAIESSLTGHLVLSTLHTNDAPSSVTRLIEMGVEPFLVGSALDSVVAQRLARRLCERCKEESVATETELRIVGIPLAGELPRVWRPVGCPQCSKTGYRGRIALHEVMGVDDEIERLASRNAPAAEISAHAEATGMTRLRGDGWAKVLLGHTSIEEVLRVTI
ncbi:MAG: type II/IV secretion system protein [Microbacterium sp.]|nr:type II/IV secretion system protein [Microbacterium sp.]